MSPKRTPKAVAYTRLSSFSGADDHSTSPERQREEVTAYAALKGWDLIDVYEDLDESGSRKGKGLGRPALAALLERVTAGDVSFVIIPAIDRLARDVRDFLAIADRLADHGAALVSLREDLNMGTPMGKAFAVILATFAELEAGIISARTAKANPTLLRAGRTRGGLLPYWLTRIPNPAGPGFVAALDDDMAPIAREIVDRTLAGDSYLVIARDLSERGVLTARDRLAVRKGGEPKGSRWHPDTIRDTVTNPALVGRVILRGAPMLDEDGMPLRNLPALVTATEWARLAEIAESRKAGPRAESVTASRSNSTLLGGLVRCAYCGGPLHARADKGKAPSYACQGRSSGAKCPGVLVSRANLDAYVTAAYLDEFGAQPRTAVEIVETGADVEAAAEIAEALAGALAAMATASADEVAGLAQRVAYLKGRQAELGAQPTATLHRLVETGETWAEAWEAATEPERRDRLAQVVGTLTVSKGKPGRHGLDPERVTLAWLGTED